MSLKSRALNLFALTAVTASLVASTARADSSPDTVFLKNGGRLRGMVTEEDPARGVTLKLIDGSVRTVKKGDLEHVEYANSAPAAASPAPAGPAPVPVTTVAPTPVVFAPAAPAAAPAPGQVGGVPIYVTQAPPVYAPPAGGLALGERHRGHRRNTGLFVTGLILMPVGAITSVAGSALVADGHDDKDRTQGEWIVVTGLAILATGLVFTIVGGRHASDRDEDVGLLRGDTTQRPPLGLTF